MQNTYLNPQQSSSCHSFLGEFPAGIVWEWGTLRNPHRNLFEPHLMAEEVAAKDGRLQVLVRAIEESGQQHGSS